MSRSRKWVTVLSGVVVAVVLAIGSTAMAHGDDNHGSPGGYGGNVSRNYGQQSQWSIGLGGGGVQFGYFNPRGGLSIGFGGGGVRPGYGGFQPGYGGHQGGHNHFHGGHSGGHNHRHGGHNNGFGAPPGGWGW